MAPDYEIFSEIKFGNIDKAISQIYKQHFPTIKKHILKEGGTTEDAQDFFQEAVLYFYSNVLNNKIQIENLNIGGYLTTVAKHKLIDKKRKDKRLDFKDEIVDNSLINNDAINHNLLQIFASKEGNVIEKMLNSVGERCKELLELTFFHKLKMSEIAQKLNYSNEDSAKTQQYKCKAKLIKLYRENTHVKNLLIELL